MIATTPTQTTNWRWKSEFECTVPGFWKWEFECTVPGFAAHYEQDRNEAPRVENLKQLVAFCQQFDSPLLPPEMACREVVENVTLATDPDRQSSAEDKLAILTVH